MMEKRKKVWFWFLFVAVVYFLVHYLVFDRNFVISSFGDFVEAGREHIWHVAPIIVAFIGLFAQDIIERFRNRRNEDLQ